MKKRIPVMFITVKDSNGMVDENNEYLTNPCWEPSDFEDAEMIAHTLVVLDENYFTPELVSVRKFCYSDSGNDNISLAFSEDNILLNKNQFYVEYGYEPEFDAHFPKYISFDIQ